MAKTAPKQHFQGHNPNNANNAKSAIKYGDRFKSVDNYIAYVHQKKISKTNPEFYYYMRGFIKKILLANITDYRLYIMISTINKKILLGVIKAQEDLVSFINKSMVDSSDALWRRENNN